MIQNNFEPRHVVMHAMEFIKGTKVDVSNRAMFEIAGQWLIRMEDSDCRGVLSHNELEISHKNQV